MPASARAGRVEERVDLARDSEGGRRRGGR